MRTILRLLSGLQFLTAISLLLFIQPGCKNYNAVDLYPPCDTVNVTYGNNLSPIIKANCLPCHTSINRFGGIVLDNADSARIPATNGLLLKAVTHDPSVFPMPLGGAKLSDCNISKFRRWINLGEPAKMQSIVKPPSDSLVKTGTIKPPQHRLVLTSRKTGIDRSVTF